MADSARQRDILAEYQALEAASDVKHELLDGVIVAMAGASPRHNELRGQFEAQLRGLLRSRGCYVASADQRVRVEAGSRYFYPDVVVACPPQFGDDRPRSLLNPRLVVEVLSPSTQDRDQGAKLDAYRDCAGLDDIVFAKINGRLVEHHHRVSESQWLVTLIRGGSLVLEELGITLPLDELYQGIDALPVDDEPTDEPRTTEKT